jgi:hypothetical protein
MTLLYSESVLLEPRHKYLCHSLQENNGKKPKSRQAALIIM